GPRCAAAIGRRARARRGSSPSQRPATRRATGRSATGRSGRRSQGSGSLGAVSLGVDVPRTSGILAFGPIAAPTLAAMTSVAIAWHSGYGHTRKLAEALSAGAESVPGVRVTSIDVATVDAAGWDALDRADAIVFGAPTYMGGPSAPFK